MAEVCIREFQYPQDYPAVYRLWENCGPGVHVGPSDTPDEIEKKMQRDPDLFLVATHEERIIGSIIGGFDGRRGMMYHLAVDPAYRREGIATRLFNELERRLKDKGCFKYYLLVVNGNEDAMSFYEKNGMEHMDIAIFGKRLL